LESEFPPSRLCFKTQKYLPTVLNRGVLLPFFGAIFSVLLNGCRPLEPEVCPGLRKPFNYIRMLLP
jgi:hypothetical protein